MLTPLYGFMEGDTLGLLVLAQDTDSISEVIRKIKVSASVRRDPHGEFILLHQGRELAVQETVASCGLGALERVDLVRKIQ